MIGFVELAEEFLPHRFARQRRKPIGAELLQAFGNFGGGKALFA